jgi:hypothetical protein
LKTLQQSVTIWLSGTSVVSIVLAIVAGQLDPVTGGIAILLSLSIAFLRRAVGAGQAEAIHTALQALGHVMLKYKTADGKINIADVQETIRMIDPIFDPMRVSDGAP